MDKACCHAGVFNMGYDRLRQSRTHIISSTLCSGWLGFTPGVNVWVPDGRHDWLKEHLGRLPSLSTPERRLLTDPESRAGLCPRYSLFILFFLRSSSTLTPREHWRFPQSFPPLILETSFRSFKLNTQALSASTILLSLTRCLHLHLLHHHHHLMTDKADTFRPETRDPDLNQRPLTPRNSHSQDWST